MDKSAGMITKLISQVTHLFNEQNYQGIADILPDQLLERYNSAALYAWKARTLKWLKQFKEGFTYAQKAIDTDPAFPMGYFARGSFWRNKNELDKAIADYDKVIQLDENYADAYYNRGNIRAIRKEFDQAIEDYSMAIRLNKNDGAAYNNRGKIWANKKEYDKAIADYDKAIHLHADDAMAYNKRGLALYLKNEYRKAIRDCNKAIQLDKNYANAYYKRAFIYKALGEYQKAITDFGRYILLKNAPSDYLTIVAKSEIEKLQINIKEPWRVVIEKMVSGIKKLLLFEKTCITHYTSLSGAKAMILENSLFRISEGAFLNDTSEGRELFEYLSFSITKGRKHELAEDFVEKPFIGSFVSEHKHNDLTLWRMYGKEGQGEAKGCALTLKRDPFINNFEIKLLPDKSAGSVSRTAEKYNFYKVAYISNNAVLIPKGEDEDKNANEDANKLLNTVLAALKEKVLALNEDQKTGIAQSLNEIAYLFKNAEYQHENEVRLVVEGVGIEKKIDAVPERPVRVYIDVIDIVPVLEKITLGPKVERPDEMAAAFNYYVKEKGKRPDVKIVISHLPFK